MRRHLILAAALMCCGASGLRADFTYHQNSRLTGGAMASAMKMASVFSKKASQPTRSTVVVKGDRMAQIDERTAQITDLQAETITTVNFKKKTYSVVTFEQMRQYMAEMARKAKKSREGGPETQIEFNVSVKETGNKRNISGMDTREFLMTMEIDSTDPQTGKSGTMVMTMSSWMADPAPGYGEVRGFYQRLGQKLSWMSGSAMDVFTRGNQGAMKGMGQIGKEAAKLKGMPVHQVMTMRFKGQGPSGEQQPAAAPQQEQEEPQSLTGAIGKRLGGLGGFGPFGRKKKQKEPQAQSQAGGQASGALMEMTTDFSGHSTAQVDPAKVDTTPAGFKRVKSEVEKALRK